ncbi:MAG: carboxy-terminal-processing protease [Chloroflexota bacterium]
MRRRAAGLVRGVWLPVLAAGLLAGCGGYGAQATAGVPAGTQAQATGVAAASSAQLPATAAARAADEPVKITGVAQITFPLFESYLVEPFVLLEDEAGFVSRNFEFEMPPENQVVGPLRKTSDGQYHYTLHLPQQPVGTLVDANHSGTPQVMVFAVAVQANLIGDPFLDRSEFRGWSTSWSSARIDSENKDEIIGGALLVWAPDAAQEFPSGFGADGLLFTSDDPVAPVPAGYTVIDLELQPFRFYKEANPQLTLYEGDVAVKDYSAMSYTEAFDAMIKKVRVEYPFTDAKAVDWDAIYASLAPRVAAAQTNADPLGFYLAIRDLTWAIPDGHLGASGDDGGLFMAEAGSGVGLGLTQLDDGRVIASFVTARSAAARAGILRGAEIIEYAGKPVAAAAAAVIPWSSPFSTQHSRSLQQFRYLTRGALGSNVAVVWRNQGASEPQAAVLVLGEERESFNALSFYAGMERGVAPVTYRVISGADLPAGGVPFKSAQTGALMDARQTGLGYIKIVCLRALCSSSRMKKCPASSLTCAKTAAAARWAPVWQPTLQKPRLSCHAAITTASAPASLKLTGRLQPSSRTTACTTRADWWCWWGPPAPVPAKMWRGCCASCRKLPCSGSTPAPACMARWAAANTCCQRTSPCKFQPAWTAICRARL